MWTLLDYSITNYGEHVYLWNNVNHHNIELGRLINDQGRLVNNEGKLMI